MWISLLQGEGHDGFLLEFEQVNTLLTQFMREQTPQYCTKERVSTGELKAKKVSIFGESEDLLLW